MGVGISKVANQLKSLDSESRLSRISKLLQGAPRATSSEDKIGISFITTQPDCRGAVWRACPTFCLAGETWFGVDKV